MFINQNSIIKQIDSNFTIIQKNSIKKTIYLIFIKSINMFDFDTIIQIVINVVIDIEINKILQHVI